MEATDFSRLKRPIRPMPSWVREALLERGLLDAYRRRPAYPQDDYLAWIARARREGTRRRRLEQMLNELERGDRYMKMPYRERERS